MSGSVWDPRLKIHKVIRVLMIGNGELTEVSMPHSVRIRKVRSDRLAHPRDLSQEIQ